MSNKKRKIAIAITGASGSIYALELLNTIRKNGGDQMEISVVLSNNAKTVWEHEIGFAFENKWNARCFDKNDFNAPFASGSSDYELLIVIPCSMGTLSRIANGTSDDLITRAADVMLKERRRLILVTRETPLNLIHIENMRKVTLAGGIICPATPSFYSKPSSIQEIVQTVTNRILSLAGISNNHFKWGE